MAVPWLAVGKLVLANLDTIIGVVKPAFTRKQVEALPSQTDLLNSRFRNFKRQHQAVRNKLGNSLHNLRKWSLHSSKPQGVLSRNARS